jgi:hypothetical protein
MGYDQKESRDEPKELFHGRACLWAMDMPQSKRNENRYFNGYGTAGRAVNRLGGVSDLIHLVRPGFERNQLADIRSRKIASRYPESIIRRFAIFLLIAE